MKHLLTKLSLGLHEQDLSKEYKDLVTKFLEKKYIKLQDHTYKLNSKYRFGVLSLPPQKEGAYLHIYGEALKDIFVASDDLMGAKDGDIVVVQRFLAKKGPASGKVVEILGREESYSVGVIIEKEGKRSLVDLKTLHPSGVEISQEQLSTYKTGSLFQINNQTNTIIKELGNINDPHTDEAIVLAQFNKHDEFEEDVLEEVKTFKEVSRQDHKHRKDLTHLSFCTIDPVTAKDFDDAIYWDAKNTTLYVAIADVSHYVKPFGALDNEAMYRGFSTYLPHRSIPMLPRILSENLCSLKPNVDRLAYVFEMKLDTKKLEVIDSDVYEAVIHSKRRFHYDEVDALFAGELKAQNETEAEIFLYLKALKKITDKLKEKRLQKGFDFRSEEISMELDEQTNLKQTHIEEQTPSHALIEDCMLLANKEAAARYERGVFRVHEEPSQAKLQNLYQELSAIGLHVEIKESTKETIEDIQQKAKEMGIEKDVDTLIIRSQMQARYAPVNLGHFGLGFERYTHFTSPIRRYADLTVHRQLKAIAQGKKKDEEYVLRNIEALCISISQLEREADSVEKEYKQRKYARWAQEHLGKTFKAKIIATTPEYKAEFQDVIQGATLYITNSTQAVLFQHVDVMIENVDIYKAKIFVKVVE
ncbi:MAG: VacB/RNase II family 3'-5' exoribonuclease [Epsilonproteobacteria bacterium]|nr:VacB/RNase II family 3'-5' exoribonuclease [Campylobacterota bacterium]